jgi:hypothetical protein
MHCYGIIESVSLSLWLVYNMLQVLIEGIIFLPAHVVKNV